MPGKEIDQIVQQGDDSPLEDDGREVEGFTFDLTDKEIANIDKTYGGPLDFDNLPDGITLIPGMPEEVGLAFSRSHGLVPRKGY